MKERRKEEECGFVGRKPHPCPSTLVHLYLAIVFEVLKLIGVNVAAPWL